MENISEHISYAEATKSSTAKSKGIDNTPNADQMKAMKNVAEKVFEPMRNHFGKPITITSFFRSPDLNKAIGGSTTSQHCKGEAIDMVATSGFTNADMFNYIKNNLEFDQLIWEYGSDANPDWVHASFKLSGDNRMMMLRATKSGYDSLGTMPKPSSGGSSSGSTSSSDSSNSSDGGSGKEGTVTGVSSSLNVRSAPVSGSVVGSLANGTKVNIVEEKDGWYRIDSPESGWVSADYVSA